MRERWYAEAARDMLGSGDALRDYARVARAVVCSLMARSLPEMQQLCAVAEKTVVHAALKFYTREYSNCLPIFNFFIVEGTWRFGPIHCSQRLVFHLLGHTMLSY